MAFRARRNLAFYCDSLFSAVRGQNIRQRSSWFCGINCTRNILLSIDVHDANQLWNRQSVQDHNRITLDALSSPGNRHYYCAVFKTEKGIVEVRVTHVINGLGRGGAEATLLRLLSADHNNDHEVVSLTDLGAIGSILTSQGHRVHSLEIGLGIKAFMSGFRELRSVLRQSRPDVVQTWLYKSDLLGGIAARSVGINEVVWNVRSSRPKLRYSKLETVLIVWLLSILSRWLPKKVVVCGERPCKEHTATGYRPDKMVVIPNGLSAKDWRRDKESKPALRQLLGVSAETRLLGQLANYHPIKRHELLLKALRPLKNYNFHLILAGTGINSENKRLVRQIRKLGLERRVTMLANKVEARDLLNGLDILVSPSASEGFPNIVLEALFMGVPCIVSDAGESSSIAAEGGWVFKPDTTDGLTSALEHSLQLNSEDLVTLGRRGRKYVVSHFSEEQMVRRYQHVWVSVQEARRN